MLKIRATQIKSTIKCNYKQKRIIEALGLGKINKSNELPFYPSVMGMIRKVSHLVVWEKL
jgi:large subunit ribosomal protein L30